MSSNNNTNKKKIQLETRDLLRVREGLQQLVDSMVDEEITNERERVENKKEMEDWLNRVFSNFPGNIHLTDNPNFNFNEPLTAGEPIDESLQYQVNESEADLKLLTDEIISKRIKTPEVMSEYARETNELKSKTAEMIKIVDRTPSVNRAAKVDQNNMKQVEEAYDNAIKLASDLEENVSVVVSKFDRIVKVADEFTK